MKFISVALLTTLVLLAAAELRAGDRFAEGFPRRHFDHCLQRGCRVGLGRQPAEEYPREVALESAAGVTYRFAPNWYAGVEAHFRAKYPLFDLNFFEHRVLYTGPSLHYAQGRWWATLTWNYQVFGKGIDEASSGQSLAEEQRNLWRLKVGFNF